MLSASAATTTCFYEGIVHHRRTAPKEHAFQYRVGFVYLDLAEAERLLKPPRPLVACAARRLPACGPIIGRSATAARRLHPRLGRRAGRLSSARARSSADRLSPLGVLDESRQLLLLLRSRRPTARGLGRRSHQHAVERADRHVLDLREAGDSVRLAAAQKVFHVSPFLAMDYAYHWRLTEPGETLELAIRLQVGNEDGAVPFVASLT